MPGGGDDVKDVLRYDRMVEMALRGVVREALAVAQSQGLPGAHHFYITFRTKTPGVDIPGYLSERYPEEMTIVLEHQFWDLEVSEGGFSVTLSFNNKSERLTIPFGAITAFADPSVKFGLQLQTTDESAQSPAPDGGEKKEKPKAAGAKSGEVVTL
ncbi:MAG TPA: ClpXP protease specificity-enhancing factor SspB, partial [Stellaceae bacterium]|nr:ClpXP protease specificity-enhancing factor SspB [Stellaceae bacterium]